MGFLFKRNKKSLLYLLFWSSPCFLLAQDNNLFIGGFGFNPIGNTKYLPPLVVDWTGGECLQLTASSPYLKWILSFGFLQNDYDKAMLFKSLDSFGWQIKVGPNPFSNYLIVQCKQEGIVITKILLSDLSGKLLYQSNGMYSGTAFHKRIHIAQISAGSYLLLIYFIVGNGVKQMRSYTLLQN